VPPFDSHSEPRLSTEVSQELLALNPELALLRLEPLSVPTAAVPARLATLSDSLRGAWPPEGRDERRRLASPDSEAENLGTGDVDRSCLAELLLPDTSPSLA